MSLFYTQIRREFKPTTWKRGQMYFREERVSNVRMEGNDVTGQIQGTDEAPYVTSINTGRGTIVKSKCSCPAHAQYENHCKHVAALSIWMVERGSLLRAGIGDKDHGVAEREQSYMLRDPQKSLADTRLQKLVKLHPELLRSSFIVRRDNMSGFVEGRDREIGNFSIPVTFSEMVALQAHVAKLDELGEKPKPTDATPVAFVRGFFQSRSMASLTIEPAFRYIDRESQVVQVQAVTHLTRQMEPGIWRTSQGIYLQLKDAQRQIPFIGNLESAKLIFNGEAALENLAKALSLSQQKEYKDLIVLHPGLDVALDPEPLKLTSLNIGKKSEKSRALTYEFMNDSLKLTSEEMAMLAEQGKLSSGYVWKDDKIYKLETSLTQLSQYANRSGIAASDSEEGGPVLGGFGTLHDDREHPLHPLAAYRLSLELGVRTFFVDEDWTEFHVWRKTFEKKRLPALPKVEYGFELRDYQTNGLTWLWSLYHRGLAALLADDMGLGKTHQVLAFLSSLYLTRGKPKQPALVVAPTSVVAAWSQKLKRYDTGLKWHVFHGKGRKLPDKSADVILTTYGILQREPDLRSKEWHVVILDEAQAIKNASTINSRAARALKAKFRIAMTGTPVENQSTDLWSLMEFLLPGYLGSLPRFKRLYGSGREGTSDQQAQALRRMVSPFLLRRTKSQVLKELPEKTEEIVHCKLTSVQKRAYRKYLQSAEAAKLRKGLEGSGKIDYAGILSMLTRLKQVCDHPKLPDLTSGKIKKVSAMNPLETGKWEALEELVSEALGSGLKIVIFTQYLGMIDLIAHWLKTQGVGHVDFRGDTPDRGARLDKFASDPECKVFICSLLAGGLGIDLTSASVCIHIDRWWNPAKENQATDRLHRIGQTRGVQVFKLQIPETVEDRIAGIIESKIELSGALVEESPLGLKAFSRRDLLQLLSPVSSDEDDDDDDDEAGDDEKAELRLADEDTLTG